MRIQLRKAAWRSVLAAMILVSAALTGGRRGGGPRSGRDRCRGGGGGSSQTFAGNMVCLCLLISRASKNVPRWMGAEVRCVSLVGDGP